MSRASPVTRLQYRRGELNRERDSCCFARGIRLLGRAYSRKMIPRMRFWHVLRAEEWMTEFQSNIRSAPRAFASLAVIRPAPETYPTTG